ncbi:hypothetical protein ACWEPL_28395 [Nonomuraea sp. NPDC004186]
MTVGLVALPAAAASPADSTTYLNVSLGVTSKSGDVAVGGGKVFVSAEDRIVVADTTGKLTGTITGLSGALGLAASPDGTRLYAALSGSNEVAEINTASLDITRRIALTAYPCPSNLSLASDRLWVGYGCPHTYGGGVLGLDLSAATAEPVAFGPNMNSAPIVAAAGDTLVFGDPGVAPTDLLVYDVSSPTPTQRGVIDGRVQDLSFVNDLAITPDGSMVISSFGSPYHYDAWDTGSLAKVRTYGQEPSFDGYALGVAISADGAHVAGGRSGGSMDIAVFDTATAAKTYTNTGPLGDLVGGSLTFSGADLFGVLREWRDGKIHLWRSQGATLKASTLTLTTPGDSVISKPLTMTGRLTLADESAPGPQPLVVTRRPQYGTPVSLPGVTTAADGTFTITDIPSAYGGTTYDVRWDGDSVFRGSAASAFTWTRFAASLTLIGPAKGVVGEPLQLKGVLDTNSGTIPGGISISVQRTLTGGDGTVTTTTLPAVTPGGDGLFGFTDTPDAAGRYAYTVRWEDTDYEPAQADHSVAVRRGRG